MTRSLLQIAPSDVPVELEDFRHASIKAGYDKSKGTLLFRSIGQLWSANLKRQEQKKEHTILNGVVEHASSESYSILMDLRFEHDDSSILALSLEGVRTAYRAGLLYNINGLSSEQRYTAGQEILGVVIADKLVAMASID